MKEDAQGAFQGIAGLRSGGRMTRRFTDELTKRGLRWVLVKGDKEERLTQAVREVNRLLTQS